jgi:hypothetical protein
VDIFRSPIVALDRAKICLYFASIWGRLMKVDFVKDLDHMPGRIRRVPIPGWQGVWHWGIEGWTLDENGQPTIWHSTKGCTVCCTNYVSFSSGRQSEILWSPSTHHQQVIVLARIKTLKGLPWRLTTANCEHVVRWAVEGTARSKQLEVAMAAGLFVGILVLSTINSRT